MENRKTEHHRTENRPLRQQIRRTFIAIIGWSVAATLVKLVGGVLLFNYGLRSRFIQPANYYEQQLPKLRTYIRAHESEILKTDFQTTLEKQIPAAGIRYQVLQKDGQILYGSLKETVITGPADLLSRVNTTLSAGRTYIQVVPLGDATGNLTGAVLLAYRLRVSTANTSGQLEPLLLLIFLLLVPFVYILLFTRLFSRRLTRRINRPLLLLQEAVEKIKARDLDFTIDYQAENELGDLCRAFSEMKEELARTLAAQWQMEQERTTMVAALAHDLKAPLAVIASYTEALQTKGRLKPERTTRYLAVIRDNVAKCSVLVKKMQYSAELEAPVVTEAPETPPVIPLKAYLEQKLAVYRQLGEAKQIRLDAELDLSTAAALTISTEKLDRILDNILTNGLEYTPSGGSIIVTAKQENERLEVSVSDSGPGFTKAALTQATRRFYRGDAARPKAGSHVGLGLFIALQLVTQLGGELTLANNTGGGARVSFWLPM